MRVVLFPQGPHSVPWKKSSLSFDSQKCPNEANVSLWNIKTLVNIYPSRHTHIVITTRNVTDPWITTQKSTVQAKKSQRNKGIWKFTQKFSNDNPYSFPRRALSWAWRERRLRPAAEPTWYRVGILITLPPPGSTCTAPRRLPSHALPSSSPLLINVVH